MKKRFDIVDLAKEESWGSLFKLISPYQGNDNPIMVFFRTLVEPPLNAKAVVVESEYVDSDYQDEFSVYYSKAFKKYGQRCTRLHFFSASIAEGSDAANLGKYADNYLGFVVIRPTDLQRMGRTVLAPPIVDEHTEFVNCRANYAAHILGQRFSIKNGAMPFIQQDTQVGACAQASLWMLARYMSHRFGYREFMPGEINQLAKAVRALGRPLPAERGLDIVQMLDALQGMGFSAVTYANDASIDSCSRHLDDAFPIIVIPEAEKDADLALRWQLRFVRSLKLADIAYRYIESGLPVIITTSNHALIAIGHTYDFGKPATVTIGRMTEFFVHNDAEGPYLKMPLFSTRIEIVKDKSGTKRVLRIGHSFWEIENIIIVMPREVTLVGEEAELMAIDCVRELLFEPISGDKPDILVGDQLVSLRPEFADWFCSLECRTYLIGSVDFQAGLRQDVDHHILKEEVGKELLCLDYPKYIWVTEFSSSTLLNQSNKQERKCLGRVIVDSTAPARTRGAIAMHFADMLVMHDRQAQESTFKKLIPNSTPCVHKLW